MGYFNWSLLQVGAPYNYFSPNLDALNDHLGKEYGGSFLGGYGVRDIRGVPGVRSPHAFGAAFDRRFNETEVRGQVINLLVTNHEVLGVQAIHDYWGSRIWHVDRYPSEPEAAWWRPQTANPRTGMGQSWAQWLHIETTREMWHDDRPIVNRLTPPPPVLGFDPANGIWGLYPLNKAKPTIRRSDFPVDQETHQLVEYLQGVMKLKASQNVAVDGDFGPSTEQAVRLLQAFFGKTVDGVVGPQTWSVVDYLASR